MTEDEAFHVYCVGDSGGATQMQIHAVAVEQCHRDYQEHAAIVEAAHALLAKLREFDDATRTRCRYEAEASALEALLR